MGIPERRERERAAMRAAILDSALALAAADGWKNVSMRKIAERIEFSATAIYEYFPNRTELLASIARRGFAQLHSSLTGTASTGEPMGRLLHLVAKCWDFAFENHALYELMVSAEVSESSTTDARDEMRRCLGLLGDAIDDVARGHRDDADDLSDILWAAINGLIALATSRRIAGGPQRARRLLDRLVLNLAGNCANLCRKSATNEHE